MIPEIVYSGHKWVIVKREQYSRSFIIILENGDSFEKSVDDSRLMLKKFGISEKDVDFILDYVQNFYAAKWNIQAQALERLTVEQADIITAELRNIGG